jgi:hypothetical protein
MTEKLASKEKQTIDDDARKFVVPRLESSVFSGSDTVSYNLIIDWIKVDGEVEQKIVRKEFQSGEVTILLVTKPTGVGNRKTDKEKISEEKYKEYLLTSKRHIEKRRYEFKIVQNGVTFLLKYDEFKGGTTRMLEVDAASAAERKLFDPSKFPSNLAEVTGNEKYYGYKMADML